MEVSNLHLDVQVERLLRYLSITFGGFSFPSEL